MRERFVGIHLDFFGFIASGLCAIHCAALPLVFAVGAFGSLTWLHDPLIEGTFIIISIALASLSLLQSYLREHKKILPLAIVLIGFGLIIGSRLVGHGGEHILTTSGGISIALAHVLNWKLLR